MSQHISQSGEELFSFPDFHDDGDLFEDEETASMGRPRLQRILIVLAIVVPALLIIGTLLVIKYRTHIVYQMKKVVQGDLVLTINATGSLHANVYTINGVGAGKLTAISVIVGQQVKKDQILAKLDPTSLQNVVDEAQLNVEAAQTALDNANADYEAIRSSVQSTLGGNLHPNPSAPPVLQPIAPVVQETEAQGEIKAAQKGVGIAQAKLDIAKYNLSNAVLKASHSGIVATINGAVGGEPGATFIQIVDSSTLQLQANVNEADIGAVNVGDGVSFSVDAYPGQSFNGNVATISPLNQSSAGVVTYPVWINVVSAVPPSIHLLPGMTAHVTVTTKERTGVLLIRASTLAFARAGGKPQAETNNQSIIEPAKIQSALSKANAMLKNDQQAISQENPMAAVVLERNVYDKIIAVPIVVGLTDGYEYEVLDGLSVNDVVLVGAKTSSN